MSDQEIAIFLRDMCRRRLIASEIALVELVADGLDIETEDRRRFEGLKTQFAADLANAGKEEAK